MLRLPAPLPPPQLIVCDEIVSGLDVSVQTAILNLLADIQLDQACCFLFIFYNLGVLRYVSDCMGVIYLGRLVERGSVERVFMAPYQPLH